MLLAATGAFERADDEAADKSQERQRDADTEPDSQHRTETAHPGVGAGEHVINRDFQRDGRLSECRNRQHEQKGEQEDHENLAAHGFEFFEHELFILW